MKTGMIYETVDPQTGEIKHEVRCTRCLQFIPVRDTYNSKCINKAACGIRISRAKRKARQEHQR